MGWKTAAAALIGPLLIGSAWAETLLDQSALNPVGNSGTINVLPVGIRESADEGLVVEEPGKTVTLRTRWGAVLILFPEADLSQIGDRLTIRLTATFDNLDSSARGLRLAVAHVPDPDSLFEALPSMESPRFTGAHAYAWNFRPQGANNEKSEIFRKTPESPHLLSPEGGSPLGHSRDPLNLTSGMSQNLTIKLEKTGPTEVSLTYEFEGLTAQTVVDSSANHFAFNSFLLFVSTRNEPASVTLKNFQVSLDPLTPTS